MTESLQRAIAEIEKLPAEAQDVIALRILAELKDDEGREARFRTMIDEQWDRLAEKVRRQITAGDTAPLDDIFPLILSLDLLI
ncbi:MAG: hypothetical protein ACM3SR_04090 [Ignavibacteriales bacterium]